MSIVLSVPLVFYVLIIFLELSVSPVFHVLTVSVVLSVSPVFMYSLCLLC